MKRAKITINWQLVPIATALMSALVFVIAFIALVLGSEAPALCAGGIAMGGISGSAFIANKMQTSKTTPVIAAPVRTPAAFPPKTGQCYVCGIIDHDRLEALGTADHPECIDWLGDWQMPRWQIRQGYYDTTLVMQTLHGLMSAKAVSDYCKQQLGSYLETGDLTARLGEGTEARVLRIPRKSSDRVQELRDDVERHRQALAQLADLRNRLERLS